MEEERRKKWKLDWGKASWAANRTDSLRCTFQFFHTENWKSVFTGGITHVRTYTVYLVSKFGTVLMWVHLCLCLWDSTLSLCPLRKATFVASGPKHPSTFNLQRQLQPQSTTRCQCVGGGGKGSFGDGILHHAEAHPSRPVPKHHVCTNNSTESDSMYTQALSGRSQIHPELSKAMDEWSELSVFSANANTSITLHHFKLYKSKSGRHGGKINTMLCDY